MTVKIAWFHLRNSTGVVDIEWEPDVVGTTVLGGKSGQGKTAILNNIAWLLGGDRYRPEQAQRTGSASYPDLDVKLTNGLRVTRKGKRSTLKVIDEEKRLGNQSMLRKFIGSFALDAPKFLRLSGKEKAEALLNIVPEVRDELRRLNTLHDELYAEREAHGRVTTQKEKYAAELEFHKDTPSEETSANALIEEIRKADAANAENDKLRLECVRREDKAAEQAEGLKRLTEQLAQDKQHRENNIKRLEDELEDARIVAEKNTSENNDLLGRERLILDKYRADVVAVTEVSETLTDQPTDALQEQLDKCEETNSRVRANAEKKAATAEGGRLRGEYAQLTDKIEDTRGAQIALLDNADLPLKPHLTVVHGELMYDGLPWDNLATSDQMKVAAAIAARENPNCGLVLLDGLETMDVDTLAEFGEWAEAEDLQVIGTRVSVGDECTLIISEGLVAEQP